MAKERILMPESFESLLGWLAPDRDKAGEKYEAIRHRLILFFTGRRCLEADGLADETIDRVILKLPQLIGMYEGERVYYFIGVARKVYQEYLRSKPQPTKLPPPPVSWSEQEFQCLEKCMEKLLPHKRRMFEEYSCGGDSGMIESRQKLTEQLGITMNALRIRVHRVRDTLKACVKDCVEREGE